MNRILIILQFYRLFIIGSIVVNLIFVWVDSHYITAIVTKFLLLGFAWYIMNETTTKRRFTFYKNLGLSPLMLFSTIFIIDSLITLLFLLVFKSLK